MTDDGHEPDPGFEQKESGALVCPACGHVAAAMDECPECGHPGT